jgi:hypothetical protein
LLSEGGIYLILLAKPLPSLNTPFESDWLSVSRSHMESCPVLIIYEVKDFIFFAFLLGLFKQLSQFVNVIRDDFTHELSLKGNSMQFGIFFLKTFHDDR